MAVEVYEQAPALTEVGAGLGLWPNAMAAFEQIGLADQVARLMRTTPWSVQLRQLDLVFALRTGRDDRQAPL